MRGARSFVPLLGSRLATPLATREKCETRSLIMRESSLHSLLFSSLLSSSCLASTLLLSCRLSLSLSLTHDLSRSLSLSLSLVPRLPSISLISRVSKSISPLVFRLPNTFRTKYPSSLILPTIPLLSSSLFFHAPECASSGSGPFPCLPFSCHNRWGTCALSRRTRRPAEISAQKERTTAGLPASASARGARPHTLRTSPRSIPSTCLAKSGRRRVAGARLLAGGGDAPCWPRTTVSKSGMCTAHLLACEQAPARTQHAPSTRAYPPHYPTQAPIRPSGSRRCRDACAGEGGLAHPNRPLQQT